MAIKDLPRKVTYKYPSGKKTRGEVIKEVFLDGRGTTMDYRNLIQLLKMENGETWVRFGYYKKKFGQGEKHWAWGSQTTLTVTQRQARKLIKMGKEKGIF